MVSHRRPTESSSDSGEVELGKSECKVTTNIPLSTIEMYGYRTVKIEFTLCNRIITNPTVARAEAKDNCVSTNIQKDFQQFCLQTVNDFESMLNDSTTADVAIKVTLGKEKTFQCHKFILTGLFLYLI